MGTTQFVVCGKVSRPGTGRSLGTWAALDYLPVSAAEAERLQGSDDVLVKRLALTVLGLNRELDLLRRGGAA